MSALLEVSGVSVSFDGFRAIDDLSFAVGEPELRAVIGPNGAGKTTFMDIVTGRTRPDRGTVRWGERGLSLVGLSESRIAREGIGRKFQRPTVLEAQTVRENLAMALRGPRGPLAVLLHRDGEPEEARILAAARTVRLDGALDRGRASCRTARSSGSRSVCCLAQEPRLVLLEPGSGTGQAPSSRLPCSRRIVRQLAALDARRDRDLGALRKRLRGPGAAGAEARARSAMPDGAARGGVDAAGGVLYSAAQRGGRPPR